MQKAGLSDNMYLLNWTILLRGSIKYPKAYTDEMYDPGNTF